MKDGLLIIDYNELLFDSQKEDQMKSITIYNLDDSLDSEIKKLAYKKGISLNKTIKDLLKKSFGLDKKNSFRRNFDEFSGIWTKNDEKEFNNAIKDLMVPEGCFDLEKKYKFKI